MMLKTLLVCAVSSVNQLYSLTFSFHITVTTTYCLLAQVDDYDYMTGTHNTATAQYVQTSLLMIAEFTVTA